MLIIDIKYKPKYNKLYYFKKKHYGPLKIITDFL